MPLVQLKGVSGFLSDEQKTQLVEKITDAVASVEGEGIRQVTWVIIDDVPEGQWGVAGQMVTLDFLRKLSMS